VFLSDADFDTKLRFVPSIIKDWLGGKMDLRHATVVDFGCDFGVITLGMARTLGARRVIGVDVNDHASGLLDFVRPRLGIERLPENLEFHTIRPGERLSGRMKVDCIASWSVFEHIAQGLLDGIVEDHREALRPGGLAFVQIAPLYYSAYGSHLESLISRPWAHLLSQHNELEEEVLSARTTTGATVNEQHGAGEPEHDAMKRALWSCYETLNKLTAADVIDLFQRHGFKLLREFRTDVKARPPASLLRAYRRDVLLNEQVVALFARR
jgi:hypothetical protein